MRRRSGFLVAGLWALLAAATAGAIDVPGTGGRVEAGGHIDGLAVVDTGGGPLQRPQAIGNVKMDAKGTEWLYGHLELLGQLGGPPNGAQAGIFNFRDTFQNKSPSLELAELYAELRSARADVFVGVQRVAWGKLDGIPPTDVINPREYHDPIVQEYEETKLGIPMVQASYYFPDIPKLSLDQLRATLIYVPIPVPPLLSFPGERWFPPTTGQSQAVIPPNQEQLCQMFGLTECFVPVTIGTANDPPARTFDAGAIAGRLSGSIRGVDWDIYHYSGPETAPNVDLTAELILDSEPPPGALPVRAIATLRQANATMHMTGFDLAAVFGGATVRAEAAFFQDRHYLRAASALVAEVLNDAEELAQIISEVQQSGRANVPLSDLFLATDSAEWGVGVDYLINGFFPLIQLTQVIPYQDATGLLISDPETRLTGLLRKRFLQDRLELECRTFWALERGSWFVFPRISYLVVENLRARLGYLAIGGPRESLIGQYKQNDEVIFEARYSF